MTTPTRFDIRQCIAHDTLDQIASAAGLSVDAILRAINSETTMPLRLSATSPTANMVLNVGNIIVTNPQTARNRTIPHISNLLPAFSSGTVTFPATSGGNITFSDSGTTVVLNCSTGNYVKVLIYITSTGLMGVSVGTQAGSATASVIPIPVANTFSIGYIQVHNTGGTIDSITNSIIYQFVGGGGGGNNNNIINVSSNVTLTAGAIHLVDTTSNLSLTMPTPASGVQVTIKDSTGYLNPNTIQVLQASSEKIETIAATYILSEPLGSWTFISNGTDWFLI